MSAHRLMGYLWMGAGAITPLLLVAYVKWNRVGPRAFWASDVCPEPNVICGNFPLVILPAAVIGFVMLTAGFHLAYPDYEWSEEDVEGRGDSA